MDFSVIRAIIIRVLFTRSIARNIALRLGLIFFTVFAISAMTFAFLGMRRESARQKERASDVIRNLSQVLELPLWTYNATEVKGVIHSVAASEDIASIKVFDDENKEVASTGSNRGYITFKRKGDIKRKNQVIGHLEVEILQDMAILRQVKTWVILFLCMSVLFLMSALSATLLLEQYVNRPMIRLIRGLRQIARGKYDARLPEVKEVELAMIGKTFAKMATELKKREKALAENIQAKTMLDTEMAVAKTIQQSMVEQCRKSRSLEIIPFYEPAQNVSGDWFSTFEGRDKRYTYVMMGDVSGHGVPQALITASVLATINCLDQTLGHKSTAMLPSEIITLVREATSPVMQQGRLAMTMVTLRIDHEDHQITLSNAGHTFPILICRDTGQGRVKELAKNPQGPIGVDLGHVVDYQDHSFPYQDGDYLCVYTDGLSTSRDKTGRQFYRVLIRFLKESTFADLSELHDFIVAQWKAHGDANALTDDICLLSIGLEGKAMKTSSGATLKGAV